MFLSTWATLHSFPAHAVVISISKSFFDQCGPCRRPRESVAVAFTHIGHHTGKKAGNTSSSFTADARIDDAKGPVLQQMKRQFLGFYITIRGQTCMKASRRYRLCPQVMEAAGEICQIFVILYLFAFFPVNFGKLNRFVKNDLSLGRRQFKPRLPSSAVRCGKTRSERVRMGECCVDYAIVRYVKNQLALRNSGAKIFLRFQPGVGGVVQLKDVLQMMIVVSDPSQDRFQVAAVLGRNQPMRIETAQLDQ